MKTNNIIKSIVAASVLSVFLLSCTGKFDEWNVNQHEATYDQVKSVLAGEYLKQLQNTVIMYRDGTTGLLDSDYQIIYNLCAELWVGYMGSTLDGDGIHNGSYSFRDGWCRAMFADKFSYAMNAYNSMVEEIDESDTHILALANVLKIISMQQVVDYYGPIPFSDAGNALNPAYDSVESIYTQMLEELDDAVEVLTAYAAVSSSIISDYDLVYGGDVTGWVKLANSLRLRCAMRIVYANETLAKAEAEKSLSATLSSGESALLLTNAYNAYIASADHHPLYEINVNFNDADTQMGATIDCYLNGYDDPRTFLIGKAAGDGKFHGVRLGIHTSNWMPYKNTANNVSAPNAGNYKVMWMNAAEVNFLCAEAALRGWNAGDTAENYYEAGVSASFDEWGASGASTYLVNSTATPSAFVDNAGSDGASAPSSITIAWNDNDNFETSLERIMTQKYLALFPNGCEAWAEYRRTGYPGLVPAANNDSNGIVSSDIGPRRVAYPISEYSNNASGVAQGVALLGGPDNQATRLWWDCKK